MDKQNNSQNEFDTILKKDELPKLKDQLGLTKISIEKMNKIYDELVAKKTEISLRNYLKLLEEKSEDSKEYLSDVEKFSSVVDIIIYKLKKLKGSLAKDENSQKEFDWIIKNLTPEMFKESSGTFLKGSKDLSLDNDQRNAFLAYSNMLNLKSQNEDRLRAVETSNKRKTCLLSLNILDPILDDAAKKETESKRFFNRGRTVHDIGLKKMNKKVNRNATNFLLRAPDEYVDSANFKSLTPQDELQISEIFKNIRSANFDIFALEKITGKNTLNVILNEIFESNQLFDEYIVPEKYENFIKAIQAGYDRNVPYHNDIHGADVLQTTYANLLNCNLIQILNLVPIDIIALCVGAACHDFKHNGYNNLYHQNAMTILGVTYNDRSILENFHAAETFKVIREPEYNLFSGLDKSEFRHIRRRMMELILATDMAEHSKMMIDLKNKLQVLEISKGKNNNLLLGKEEAKYFENQQTMLNLLIHSSDLSNPAKIEKVYDKWVDLLFTEFFAQGDTEIKDGLPISPLCDRKNTVIPNAQIGFINFVVKPIFVILNDFFPGAEGYCENIEKNLERYKKKAEALQKNSTKK